MTTLQAFDRIGAETTSRLLDRLSPPQVAPAEPPPARPTLAWVIDAQTGRPVCSWMVR